MKRNSQLPGPTQIKSIFKTKDKDCLLEPVTEERSIMRQALHLEAED
jgi:hypothetical protein